MKSDRSTPISRYAYSTSGSAGVIYEICFSRQGGDEFRATGFGHIVLLGEKHWHPNALRPQYLEVAETYIVIGKNERTHRTQAL